ncbi:tail protein [Microcystis phage Mwe-Yong1]|nr:tail protein [Microcystis phage Mwe-Yong1]
MSSSTVPVLAMPMLDPGAGRIDVEMPTGMTVEEIVCHVLRDAPADLLDRCRVSLVTDRGLAVLGDRQQWHAVRPRAGVRVLIRVIPGNSDFLRSALLIAVSVAATALGQVWAPGLVAALGIPSALTGVVAGGIAAGLTIAGSLLVNALIPAAQPGERERPAYLISGWRNSAAPDGVLASILGRHRYAPVFLAPPYIEIVGDEQYIRAIFGWGYGPMQISDLKLGETPLTNFSDIDVETREGYPDDEPLTLYTQQVVDEQLGTELRRDRPRDSAGNVTGGTGPETPVLRLSAGDSTGCCLIFSFPGGLVKFDGDKARSLSVQVRMRMRLVGETDWATTETLTFSANKREGFFRSRSFTFPSRGRWEIELTRMTNERTSTAETDRIVWLSLQSFRPEAPINCPHAIAMTAMRVRSTYQLNGSLDNLNGIVERIVPDWDADTETWIARPTRNPASLFRHALQGAESPFAEPDENINLEQLIDWHGFCVANGLTYSRIHDFEGSRWEVLTAIAAAGRAKPTELGGKWGVVIDRPQTLVADHVSPRNSREFSWSRPYYEAPHAFRIPFLDETSDYQSRERVVRWPGYNGPITVTEELQLPGKTNPSEVWLEARRRQYDVIYRPERISITQDGLLRQTTRGDLVKASRLTFDQPQAALRVTVVSGTHVSLDGSFEMEAGHDYACRFFVVTVGEDGEDTWSSTVRPIVAVPGEHSTFVLEGAGALPQLGSIVQIGQAGHESTDLIVSEVESGNGNTSVLSLVAAAPEIDEQLALDTPPAWDGRVGDLSAPSDAEPEVPVFEAVSTHFQDGVAAGLTVLLRPGEGSVAVVASFEVRHRLAGSGAWTVVSIPAGSAGTDILGYGAGNTVELQARGISNAAIAGDWTAVVEYTLEAPAAAPSPVPSASVTGGLGAASFVFSTPSGPNFDHVNLYRGPTADIGDADLVATIYGSPVSTYSHVDGDAARPNLLAEPDFSASGASWTLGSDWTVVAEKAQKTPGSTSSLTQAVAFDGGDTYRFALTISGRTAGTLTPGLTGGTPVTEPASSANGRVIGSLVAAAGNNTFDLAADTGFDGSVDDVALFKQSPTSVPQGTHYYFMTAANSEGAESAPLALGAVSIV